MTASRRVLPTPRIDLEPLGAHHAPDLWDATVRSLDELKPFMSWADTASFETTLAFASGGALQWDAGTGMVFAIMIGGEAAGTIGFAQHAPLAGHAELGYWLRSDLCGRGLMTEAASSVVDYGFGVLHLHRIELRAAPSNVGSVRVAEKVGFKREGTLRHGARGADGWHDVDVYGLLESDDRRIGHAPGDSAAGM
ncbi:MAG: GNAT family N-acetyltransferase [Actinomycetota bacterium]|nr:GNAT family N-acetyltransferase [Actinomycetota bacterium]